MAMTPNFRVPSKADLAKLPVLTTEDLAGKNLTWSEKVKLAKERIKRYGYPFKTWAEVNGFSRDSVYSVLSNRGMCSRGETYKVAVRMGLITVPESIAASFSQH